MWGDRVAGGVGKGNPPDAFNSILNTCSTSAFLPTPGDVY